jgi:pimeloyl-ACP methyl ester carboxylesterase
VVSRGLQLRSFCVSVGPSCFLISSADRLRGARNSFVAAGRRDQDGVTSARFVIAREGCEVVRERWLSSNPLRHIGDLLAVLDREEVEQASLAGASAGGGLALDTALLAPDRVAHS